MVPIILLTRSKKRAQKYIADFIKKEHIEQTSIFIFEVDGTIITIDQIREINHLFIRSDSAKKLIVIYDFETAKEATQNALLKTLEEKSDIAQFIITAKNEQMLLPTILSRAVTKRISQDVIKDGTINPVGEITELFSQFSGLEKNSEKAIALCDELLLFFKNSLINRTDIHSLRACQSLPKIVKEILSVRSTIDRNNLGSQIAADHLFLYIRKHYKQSQA